MRRAPDVPGADRVPFVPQRADNDCGPACLAMALCYFGRATELAEAVASVEIGQSGVDVWSLLEAARRFGLDGEGVRLEDAEALSLVPPGSVLHWSFGRSASGHYVVIESSLPGGGVRIVDPAYGPREVTSRAISRNFSGIAIVLAPGPDFRPRPGEARPVAKRELIGLRAVFWWYRLLSLLRRAVGRPGSRRQFHSASSTAAPPGSEP